MFMSLSCVYFSKLSHGRIKSESVIFRDHGPTPQPSGGNPIPEGPGGASATPFDHDHHPPCRSSISTRTVHALRLPHLSRALSQPKGHSGACGRHGNRCKSQRQSGYCRTNDGREGQRNKREDRGRKSPPEECNWAAAAEQHQSRSALPSAGCL
jgi:hypothetical protein